MAAGREKTEREGTNGEGKAKGGETGMSGRRREVEQLAQGRRFSNLISIYLLSDTKIWRDKCC